MILAVKMRGLIISIQKTRDSPKARDTVEVLACVGSGETYAKVSHVWFTSLLKQ
jgi:hypothetical protein